MIDLHVHTHHSCDSNAAMEDYCREALTRGVKCLCFTDHIDCNPVDNGYGFYHAEKFFDEFEEVREKYSGELCLLSGIEFGEPHIYRKEFDEYRKLPYDFILGSIHFWMQDIFPSQLVKTDIPVETVFEKYWEEVYRAVCYGGFDALAHIDFPKRYYKRCIWSPAQMDNIFKAMAANDIALEINTSSLRKGLTECMPGREMLELYEKAGGIKVTIGADTHKPEDLASDYSHALSLVQQPLESVVFIKRKPVYETSTMID